MLQSHLRRCYIIKGWYGVGWFVQHRGIAMQRKTTQVRVCSAVDEGELNRRRRDCYRPGVKALLFDDKGRVLLGRLPDGYPNRFNLPGGGIDDGELLAESLAREFEEEVKGPPLSAENIASAPIVAEGRLPFPRDDFLGKYEYLVALPVPFVGLYKPKAESKLVCFPPLHWRNAFQTIRCATYVKRDLRLLYMRAVRQVGWMVDGV